LATLRQESPSDPTPAAPDSPGVDWRGRSIVLLQFTLLACVANSLALQLPGSTPFLVGNMAAVAVALRFGLRLSLPVALCASGITGSLEWVALAILECVLVSHWRHRAWSVFTLWWRVWLPLLPVVAWITLPRGADDPLLWLGGISVVLATGATSIIGGRQLAGVTRSRRQRAGQPLAQQLSVQLSTLMAAPATVVIMLLVQWGHQVDVQRTAFFIDGKAEQLAVGTAQEVRRHRDAVAQAALSVPALGVAPVLQQVATVYPGFLSLLGTDRLGRVQYSLLRGEAPQRSTSDVSDRAYFRETMQREQPTISPVFRGRGIGTDLIVAVAAPIRAADGSVDGVLQGSLALGQLVREERTRLDVAALRYAVSDAVGQVVMSSLPDLPVKASASVARGRLEGTRAQPWWALHLYAAPRLLFDANQQYLVATHEVEGIAWQVRVLQPLRPLEQRQTLRSLLAAAFVLAIILGVQRLARRFANSHIRGLTQVVERLRSLDPSLADHRFDRTMEASSAELSALIQDFEATEARLQSMHAALSDAAAQQQALNRELEARVELRTLELRQALARAEHLAAAKSSFLANMSHELRTPLAAILGYSEQGLREDAKAGEIRRCLQTVVRNGRHLLEIVNDVLDASKIEAGQLHVQQQAVAPLPLVGEAIELLRPRAQEKNLQLVLSAHWPLPAQVRADPLRLKQVLLNLLSNAIKFTPHGFVAIRVRADAGTDRWSVEVEDTGIGMDEVQCERVFQRFEQADESTTRRFGGTGLGLYISRQLARQMGGDLTATSTPGAGSRFLLTLPVGVALPWRDEGDDLPATEMPRLAETPRLRGRVLVADDVDDLRALLRVFIEATGAEVTEAANGREALARLAEASPDLVLMDMHMPVMDGRDAVAQLRREGHRLPVYACSADVMAADVASFIAIGCDGALGKPIDAGALHAVLSKHLAPADAVASSSPPAPATAPAATPTPPAATAPESDPLAAAMAQIRQRFVAKVPEERATLAAALETAASGAGREALMQLAHRLKGSAGTFGFDAISTAAGQLERAAKSPTAAVDSEAAALDQQLAALQSPEATPGPKDATP
jgi:signal transduction histidine kinase/CheY-like chemotaxis protein